MISKLIAWGDDRAEATARMKRALDEYYVGGIRTTIPFFRAVLDDAEFRAGEIDTDFITRFLAREQAARDRAGDSPSDAPLADDHLVAAIVAAVNFARETHQSENVFYAPQSGGESKWKLAGRYAVLKR